MSKDADTALPSLEGLVDGEGESDGREDGGSTVSEGGWRKGHFENYYHCVEIKL